MAVLDPQARQRLLHILGDIPALGSSAGHDLLLVHLPPDWVRHIPRSPDAQDDLASIIDTCAAAALLPDGSHPLLVLLDTVLDQLAGSPLGDQLQAIYDAVQAALPSQARGSRYSIEALPDNPSRGAGDSLAVTGAHVRALPVLPLTGGDDPAHAEALPEERGLESATRGQAAAPPSAEPAPAQKEVYALARWPTVEASTLTVGATYVLEAGVSPVPYSGGPHETAASMPFKVDVPAGGEPIEFFIMVRPGSAALAVVGLWQQTLQFQIQQAAPQVVQFHIRAVTAGPAQIAVDFYHEKHWLQTVTFQLTLLRALSLQ